MKKTITLNITEKELERLKKHNFDFDKEISDFLRLESLKLANKEKAKQARTRDPFEQVTAVYTGGNIWLFYGELTTGEYFLTDDNGCTMILDASPEDLDESLYEEWQEDHFLRVVGTRKEELAFLLALIDRLGKRLPVDDGGYISDDELDTYKNDWSYCYKENWGVEI